ncbi:MAG TPA: hypothetical protein ENK60_00745 [Anaerolineae bacterium]|nr:hypothetical protein [Anaerolineae bacterium]
MTKSRISNALWGLLTIILGIAALAYNFGALDDYKLITAYAVAALLAVMGAVFLLALAFQRDQWFYVIPGFSFLSLGGIVYLATQNAVPPEWLGALFLGGIALGFIVVFLQNRRERWWALLQAETILLIALLGLGLGIPQNSEKLVGTLLFGGFAASFFFVWLLSSAQERMTWALILAGVLAIFAAIIYTSGQGPLLLLLWPGLLLLIGFFLVARVFTGGKQPSPAVDIEAVNPIEPTTTDEEAPARIIVPPTRSSRTGLDVIEPEVVDGNESGNGEE